MKPIASPLGIVYAALLRHGTNSQLRVAGCPCCSPFHTPAEPRERERPLRSTSRSETKKAARTWNESLPPLSPADASDFLEDIR